MRFVKVKLCNEVMDREEYPETFPAECVEFEAPTFADAVALYPGERVMPVDEYNLYKSIADSGFEAKLLGKEEPGFWSSLWTRFFGGSNGT